MCINHDEYLTVDDTKDTKTDIPPGAVVYFLLGSGWDESDSGMVDSGVVNRLLFGVDENTPSRFWITTTSGISVPRNNDYKATVSLHADDMPCKEYTLAIYAKDKLKVFLTRAGGSV